MMWIVVVLKITTFVLGPWVVIWGLNTLLTLSIPITFDTYTAALILLLYLGPSGVSK